MVIYGSRVDFSMAVGRAINNCFKALMLLTRCLNS